MIYFLIITYLFSFSEARQVLKIPNLVEHYVFHKITNSGTSLFSFIKMHYLDAQVLDEDYHQDMKLPFKTHETNAFSMSSLTIPDRFVFAVNVPEIFGAEAPVFSYSSNYTSNPLASIFRPPILI